MRVMDAIEVKNITYSYIEGKPVLNNISFKVKKGSFVSLIGRNGSGKSTLAKLLVGLLKAEKGEIILDGVTLTKDNISLLRKKVAIVFQNPDNQFIGSTVEDDIAFGLENREVPQSEMKEKVIEAARNVGMLEYLDKEPSHLSGGQKQRVAIADALAMNPDILILDEATAMLDPRGRKEVRDLISKMRINNKDLTIISITHDIEEAYLSDQVIVLDKDQIEIECSPEELFNNDELVAKFKLNLPFAVELKKKLNDKKFSSCKTMEEIGEILCQFK